LARALGDDLVVVNYVDHDPTAGVLDYEGGMHTYDGHAGTDYSLLNFRLMDRGCPILAAADGTVAYLSAVAPGAFDRNCGAEPTPDDGTWVWVDNGDGTYSEYYHLRAWSLQVAAGETIHTGQIIGLVGSSGYSTFPHLHFETGDYFGGPYQPRDPYTGPDNPLPSLWVDQEPYHGGDFLDFVDGGIYSDDVVGGSVGNTTYCDIVEGIQGPEVFGIHEPDLDIWLQFQGNRADSFRVEVVKPDGSTWASYSSALGYDARFDWFWVYWPWEGSVGPADYGTWKVRAYALGALSREIPFEVGPVTVYSPRFRPAGRSFRVNGSAQRDTLRLTPQSPPVTFSLVGAPTEVGLADSVLTVGGTSSQSGRAAFFRVVAVDGSARADTAWFHLVDMSKPLAEAVGVGETPPPARLRLLADPNPAAGPVALRFTLPSPGRTRIRIVDVAGRQVRTLADRDMAAGRSAVTWDGRDDAGRPVAPGLYYVSLRTPAGVAAARVALVR
jgi:murein DD-endopeptidase MepM/ murein hydrolase activator NlpD